MMARHLRPGGVLIVEPFFTPDAWVPGRPAAIFVDRPDLKLARMNVSAQEGNVAILDFHYLVATPEGVEHFSERHELGLFTQDEYCQAAVLAGLETTFDEHGLTGRGLLIGARSLATAQTSTD